MEVKQEQVETVTEIARYYVAQLESLFCAAEGSDQTEISAQVADLNVRMMSALIAPGRQQ